MGHFDLIFFIVLDFKVKILLLIYYLVQNFYLFPVFKASAYSAPLLRLVTIEHRQPPLLLTGDKSKLSF